MKKLSVLSLLLFLVLPAMAVVTRSGHRTQQNFVLMDESLRSGPGGTQQLARTNILYKIRAGQPLFVQVKADGIDWTEAQLLEAVHAYYSRWFENARQHIRAQRLEKEFQWALPLLQEQNIQIVPAGNREPDLIFYWQAEEIIARGAQTANGARRTGWQAGKEVGCPLKSLTDPRDSVCLHEVGHTLGFGEQYPMQGADRKSSALGSHRRAEDGMMGWEDSSKQNRKFHCDDANGLLVLLSLTFPEEQRPVVKSVCPGSDEVFVNGMSTRGAPLSITQDPQDKTVFYVTRQNSAKYSERFELAMNTRLADTQSWQLVEVTEPDASGRPVIGKGRQGETIYFAYTGGDDQRGARNILVVKNKKVIVYLRNEYTPDVNVRVANTMALFGSGGKNLVQAFYFAGNRTHTQGTLKWRQDDLHTEKHVNCTYQLQGDNVSVKEGTRGGCIERGAQQRTAETSAKEQAFQSQLLTWKKQLIPQLEKVPLACLLRSLGIKCPSLR